ncbi:MAG: hypothetical protein IJ677_01005 [Alphaproteobacteria bacterium]|nr:hypothetical protein [Alphaproteobacteria bacterium]
MRFLLILFGSILFSPTIWAEDMSSAVETETDNWQQIEKDLNSDWNVDLSQSDTNEENKNSEPQAIEEKKDSKIIPFAAGYLLGKTY